MNSGRVVLVLVPLSIRIFSGPVFAELSGQQLVQRLKRFADEANTATKANDH